MPLPLVIAYHLIWSGYGWWLPNDVRGSMSRFVYSDLLRQLGELHFGRRRVQPARHMLLTEFDFARERLKHEMLEFGRAEVSAIADAFGLAIAELRYTCYACAIMPDHVPCVDPQAPGFRRRDDLQPPGSQPLAASHSGSLPGNSSGVGRSRLESVPRPPG